MKIRKNKNSVTIKTRYAEETFDIKDLIDLCKLLVISSAIIILLYVYSIMLICFFECFTRNIF